MQKMTIAAQPPKAAAPAWPLSGPEPKMNPETATSNAASAQSTKPTRTIAILKKQSLPAASAWQ